MPTFLRSSLDRLYMECIMVDFIKAWTRFQYPWQHFKRFLGKYGHTRIKVTTWHSYVSPVFFVEFRRRTASC